jgi:phage tail sheath protein FI
MGALVETFDQVSLNEFIGATDFPNPDHVERRINGVSRYITVHDVTTDRTKIDPPLFTTAQIPLTGGTDGAKPGTTSANLQPQDLIGTEATITDPATGLHAFDPVDDINIVAIPDLVNPGFAVGGARDATIAGFTYCENRKDCFFVADAPSGLSPQKALNYKRGTDPSGQAFNSKYGAFYYPWIYITDPITGERKKFPPSGAAVGSYSAADVRVGVHKAPAGTADGFLNSAVDIERVITQGEQDTLNPEGVNVIRKFPDAGIVLWGARTVSADSEWKYVNVRRLFIFLEESILKGTQGVVFEPNDPVLWKRITRDVSAFLRIQWLEGKLVGDKPEKAFFVKCDEETNPPESIDLGRVITLIGVAPSKPAEFVIFRISQSRVGSGVTE